MEIAFRILLLLIGFILLIKGADALISGASSLATHSRVSKMLIGLTVVAFGNALPELAISISSLISGNTDILLGNIIGSNITDALLLVGIGAMIHPIVVKKDTVRKEIPILLLISTVLAVLFLDTSIFSDKTNLFSRGDGIVCILFFSVFVYYLLVMAKRNRNSKAKKYERAKYSLGKSWFFIILGLIGLVIGSQLIVDGASSLALMLGIPDRIIALTIVTIGTTSPELIITIKAAKRGENDLLIGNIIGNNIFNICIVLGLPVAIFGAITLDNFETFDLIMLIGSSLLLWLFTTKDRKISRLEGGALLMIFAIYYTYVIYGGLIA